MIERAARDPAIDMDKMERLLGMQREVMALRAKAAYDEALAQLQCELPEIPRAGRITIRDKFSNAVRQRTGYALWEDVNAAIKPVLAKHGFSLSFRIAQPTEGKVAVTGILAHRDGHREETTIPLPVDMTGSKNAVQAMGSSTSYGKRYTAGALLNLTSRGEDDDGQAGGGEAALSEESLDEIQALIVRAGVPIERFCAVMGVATVQDLKETDFERAKKKLLQRIAGRQAARPQ